jgi:hypothetical protein
MVDCSKFWCLHNMHSSKNMRGWQLVYEPDSYSLCWYCVQQSWFENVLGYLQWSSLMRIYIHMEELRISNLLNWLLHEFLGLTPAINLKIFFCKVNIFLLLDKLLQKIIPYFIMEWK